MLTEKEIADLDAVAEKLHASFEREHAFTGEGYTTRREIVADGIRCTFAARDTGLTVVANIASDGTVTMQADDGSGAKDPGDPSLSKDRSDVCARMATATQDDPPTAEPIELLHEVRDATSERPA